MRILFRSAVLDDVEFLLSLRNDPSAWSQFIQARYVSKEEHFEWFKGVLKRDDVKVFIILYGDTSVGYVRYEINEARALVSIAISAEYRGKGFGTQALKLTGQKILCLPNVTALKALVKENNKESLRCFENVGFCRVDREKKGNEYFIIMELGKAT